MCSGISAGPFAKQHSVEEHLEKCVDSVSLSFFFVPTRLAVSGPAAIPATAKVADASEGEREASSGKLSAKLLGYLDEGKHAESNLPNGKW
jgi:hypothetical protein